MKILEVVEHLNEQFLPYYQEGWDNCGLLVGNAMQEISGALVCLDVTPPVIEEAIEKHCNLIVSHHPLIYKGIMRLTPDTETGRMLLRLAQQDICVYAAHTDLDKLSWGVSGELIQRLGVQQYQILDPIAGALKKLVTYCPTAAADTVRAALWNAGAGHIGAYSHCSYNLQGTGTFCADNTTHPYVGTKGELHHEEETRIEVIYEARQERKLLKKLLAAHPYEEPAYDLIPITNHYPLNGLGACGTLPSPLPVDHFLAMVKELLHLPLLRTSALCRTTIEKIAVCGGSGASLIGKAKSVGADIYLCGDLKYHEFQQASGDIIVADIGHYESEQFAKDIIYRVISEKFSNFATQMAERDKGFIVYV